jgi:hypothetical protein
MKFTLLLALLGASLLAWAQDGIPGTIPISAPIAPTGTNSGFGVTLPVYGTGSMLTGLGSLADLQDLNRYPMGRRHAGMYAALTNGVMYQLGQDLRTWQPAADINVTSFGAIGNGVVDCTTAIANAIAVGKLIQMPVFIPPGNYLISAPLDCQNSGDNNLEFPGVYGAGFSLTRLTMTTTNVPIFVLRGRGGTYRDFKVQYQNQAANTDTGAIAFQLNGFVYFTRFQNLEVLNGYCGFKSVAVGGAQTTFSCTFDNVCVRNFYGGCFDVLSSSGNAYINIYCSNPSLDAVDFIFADRAGASTYGQMNFEHSNIRTGPVMQMAGDAASIQMLHVEGIRWLTDSCMLSPGNCTLEVSACTFINNYIAGHWISGITASGTTATATVNNLTSAVSGGHGFRVGDQVTLTGATDSLYNGAHTITAVTPTTFSYSLSGTPSGDAIINQLGGFDFIHAYLGNYPAIALFSTTQFGGGKVHLTALMARNNKIIYANSASRALGGVVLAREFGGKRLKVAVDFINMGSAAFRVGDQFLGPDPVVASWRYDTNALIYTQLPHQLNQGDYISLSGGSGLNFGTNYIQTAEVIDAHTLRVTFPDSKTLGLIRETGSLVPVKARIVQRSRTNNVATVTTDVAHFLAVGNNGNVRFMSDPAYANANMIVTAVGSSTNFSYTSVGPNEALTAETAGILSAYSSGLNVSPQSSSSKALMKAGFYSRSLVCVPATNLPSLALTYYATSMGGIRLGDAVELTPYLVNGGDPNQRQWGFCATNDMVTVGLGNPTPISGVNVDSLWWVDITGNLGGTNQPVAYSMTGWPVNQGANYSWSGTHLFSGSVSTLGQVTFGDSAAASPVPEFRNLGASAPMKWSRIGVAAVQPSISGGAGGAVFILTDTTNNRPMVSFDATVSTTRRAKLGGYNNITTPQLGVLQAEDANGASLTDVGGAPLRLQAGFGTGFATPSTVSLWTPDATVTGTTQQAVTEKLRVGTDVNALLGSVLVSTAGKGIKVKEGSNATMGISGAMVGGTVTVNTTAVTANSRIHLTPQALGTVTRPAAVGVSARVGATSFTITSSDPTDTSTVAWIIVEPAP